MSNPVPSDKISDGKLNFGTADVMVNSDDHTVTTRTGKVIRTFAGINAEFDAAQAGQFVAESTAQADRAESEAERAETAAEVAAAAGRVYETSGDGQADSELVDGDYFWVVSAEDSEVLELWRKGASSATDTGKRTASAQIQSQVNENRLRIDKLEQFGQLRALKNDLNNPLSQRVNIVLIGDSITWGMSADGMADREPRSRELTDARNNETSDSWANLLHRYLGAEYMRGSALTSSPWPDTPSGVAIFEYEKEIGLFTGQSPINSFAGGNDGEAWTTNSAGGAKFGFTYQAQIQSSASDFRLTFKMTGSEFDFVFATLNSGALYKVFVNGDEIGEFSTNNADLGTSTAFGFVRTHSLGGFFRDALVEIRPVAGVSGKTILRTEGVIINKAVRVTNNGIVGDNLTRYLDVNFDDAVRADDDYCFVMFGTNDRNQDTSQGVPAAIGTFYESLLQACERLEINNTIPILMCANATNDNDVEGERTFTMGDARNVIASVSDKLGVSFLDHYATTKPLLDSGDLSYLTDSLHPSDLGHKIIFDRIKSSIDGA